MKRPAVAGPFPFLALVAQHGDLPLNQRDRLATVVLQRNIREQLRIAVEKIRMLLQKMQNVLFGNPR